MQGAEYYVNLSTSVVMTEQNNITAKREELIGTIEYLTLYVRWGDRGNTVVKVLCYKSEGPWFDPSWCHLIFH